MKSSNCVNFPLLKRNEYLFLVLFEKREHLTNIPIGNSNCHFSHSCFKSQIRKALSSISTKIAARIFRIHAHIFLYFSLILQSAVFHKFTKFEQCMADLLEYLVLSAKNDVRGDWNWTMWTLFECPETNISTNLFFGHIQPERVSEIDGSSNGPNLLSLAIMTTQFDGSFLLSHALQKARIVTHSSDLDIVVGGNLNPVRPARGWRPILEKLCAEVNCANHQKKPVLVWREGGALIGAPDTVLLFGSKEGMLFHWKMEIQQRICWGCGRG